MPSRTRPYAANPLLEHGKPGNSACLFYYGFVLFAQLCPRHRSDFLICLMRIREDLLKGAEQSCEGQADSSAVRAGRLGHGGPWCRSSRLPSSRTSRKRCCPTSRTWQILEKDGAGTAIDQRPN